MCGYVTVQAITGLIFSVRFETTDDRKTCMLVSFFSLALNECLIYS